jgi:NADH-quinone oxidoreductase subunit M
MLTAILIFLPLLASFLVFFTKGGSAKKIALAFSIVEFAVALFAAFNFHRDATTQFILDFWWMPSLGISFKVGIDGISLLLVLLTTALVPFIILSSFEKKYEKPNVFYGLILMMQMALVGVFTSMDGFLFYIFWELALIPIYFICLMWGGKNRGVVTFKFFVYTLFGSLFMLVGLIYLYQHSSAHNFDIQSLYQAGHSLPASTQGILFWAFFIAFAIKMPVFPFHTWQPDTYTEAPTQGTMLLSGIMLKMGIFGVIRWLLPVVPLGVAEWGNTAIILSVIGIVYASVIAIMQNDMKRLVAYSSIAHVGLIAAGVFSMNVQGLQGAMIQMVCHGINVFALFYIIDLIEKRTGTRELSKLGGVRSISPIFATVFMIIVLGSVALPFTNGFVGEFLLINGLYQFSPLAAAFAGLTIILGAVYMLRMYQKSMLGELSPLTEDFEELTYNEKLVLYPMVIAIIGIGIFPKPLLHISEPAVEELLRIIALK